MGQAIQAVKLCPHCANSVALEASKCPYCKAELKPGESHEWPQRPERTSEPVMTGPISAGMSRNLNSIVIVASVFLVLLLAAFIFVGQRQRGGGNAGVAANADEIRGKDQKIESLEAELAKLRAGDQGRSSQVEELKAKLDESEKDLASARRKLAEANREIERLSSSRVASAPPTTRRSADPLPPPVAPVTRAAAPGIYETRRATVVYEEPSDSARVVTRIDKSTIVTVVRSAGDWLEVRSKHGKPPGFIRSDDAVFVSRSN
jgi:hypothetical protein